MAYNFDALYSGYKWSATDLKYFFPTSRPSYYGGLDVWNVNGFNVNQIAAAKAAMDAASQVCNVKFSQGTSAETSQITWANGDNGASSTTTAYSYFPNQASLISGDIWIENNNLGAHGTGNPIKGTYGYETYIHELGHALGLKHPFEGAVQYTSAQENYWKYTVMAYSYVTDPQAPVSYQLYDIATLQQMYGANMSYATGNDTYNYAYLSDTRTIWDAAGNDTLDVSSSTLSSTINLNPGTFSSIGLNHAGNANSENLAIAYNCYIENVTTGSNVDYVTGNALANLIKTNAGYDNVNAGGGNDTIDGGADADLIHGDEGNDVIYSGAGGVASNSIGDKLYGDAGDDTIIVTGAALTGSVYDGGTGYDTLDFSQSTAAVTINLNNTSAVSGFEAVYGSSLADSVIGDATDNNISGNDGNDTINAGTGTDYVRGGVGDDYLYGGVGDDGLYGDAGNDHLYGGSENDRLYGGNGSDTMYGDEGNDFFYGAQNDDVMIGGAGDDTLAGGSGNDYFDGGIGNDFLDGYGSTNDVFVFGLGYGRDTIASFRDFVMYNKDLPEVDVVDLHGYAGYKTFTDVMAHASQVGYDVVINFSASDVLTLQNINISTLTFHDFTGYATV